jgi:hypothetical protein
MMMAVVSPPRRPVCPTSDLNGQILLRRNMDFGRR